jgi:hypothetical protein
MVENAPPLWIVLKFRDQNGLRDIEGKMEAVNEAQPDPKAEVGIVYDEKANQISRLIMGTSAGQGGQAQVNITSPETTKLLEGSQDLIVTHTHPQGLPLSEGDIGVAAAHNYKEIRAVGFVTTTAMERGANGWGNWLEEQRSQQTDPKRLTFDVQSQYWSPASSRWNSLTTENKLGHFGIIANTRFQQTGGAVISTDEFVNGTKINGREPAKWFWHYYVLVHLQSLIFG